MPDVISLEQWEVSCILGVLEREQRTPQPLRISVRMEIDLEPASSGDLTRSVNYAAVRDQVSFLVQHGRFRLLESIAFGVVRLLLLPPADGEARGSLTAVEVSLSKPEVLGDAVPGISVRREAGSCELAPIELDEDILAHPLVTTPRSSAHRIDLEPAASWPVPPEVAVLVLAGSVRGDDRVCRVGDRTAPSEVSQVVAEDRGAALLVVGLRA